MNKEKMRDSLIRDCFGNVAGRAHCHILTEDVCLYGECPFYKTRAQYRADREKYERMSGRERIAVKHRKGRTIRCIENNRIYKSVLEAAEDLQVTVNCIYMVLSGKQADTYGLRFEYVD